MLNMEIHHGCLINLRRNRATEHQDGAVIVGGKGITSEARTEKKSAWFVWPPEKGDEIQKLNITKMHQNAGFKHQFDMF